MTNEQAIINAMNYYIKHESNPDYLEATLVIKDILSDPKLFGSLMASMQFIFAAIGPDMIRPFFSSVNYMMNKYSNEEFDEIIMGMKK